MTPPASPSADYDVVRRAIAFLSTHAQDQPDLERIAAHVGLAPDALHALFVRWAGLTPKAFLQAVTLDHAKRLLDAEATVLDTALEVGLSGPGRLHDLFVTHEAVTPGVWRARGEGLTIAHGRHATPFGDAVLFATPNGLAGLVFVEDGEEEALDDMRRRWPRAQLHRDEAATAPYAERVFERGRWRPDAPLRIVLIGTDFEVRVWETLLSVPFGGATSYGALARRIERPGAARAVGRAVGANPLAFVVPCHRVVGTAGALTGYRWGLTRKRAMLGWESGAVAA